MENRPLRHGSLFSGIGGFDLASQWMGWENVFQVEKDEFCQKVLEKNFPNTKRYGDIKEFDGTKYRGAIDILTGGFPCQGFSTAGRGLGDKDERFLWEEMLRVAQELKPAWIVAENVRGLIAKKFSHIFESICSSLETEGYEIQSFIIPATAIGATHERYRLWIVANSPGIRLSGSGPLLGQMQSTPIADRETNRFIDFIQRNAMPYVCGDHHGISRKLDEHRIKSLGNAIVPQIAFEIFKAIETLTP